MEQRAEEYEPLRPECRRVWARLGEAERAERFAAARNKEDAIRSVRSAVETDKESERKAVQRLVRWSHRSNYRRWVERYDVYGFDGLIDCRMPPNTQTPESVRNAICTLRRVDPEIGIEAIIAHVKRHHAYVTSTTTVKRVLRRAGLARRRGRVAGWKGAERRLEMGGMKLIEAAYIETGYLEALALGVDAQRCEAQAGPDAGQADGSDRDEYGRFMASYNERYRKGEDDVIGPGFASVEEKRAALDPERLHLRNVSVSNLARKLYAVSVSPLLGSGRWDGIRVSRGHLLGELCGYPYMPSTLELFTRELKLLGVSSTLWEVHARVWHCQTKGWGDTRASAVFYIDETNKPVWTTKFSQATKVSSVGRVMPGLEVACVHSGYGVPLWQATHSGRAPLVKAVPKLLEEMEAILDGADVGRIVVIDAEGNSIPFLRGLEEGEPKRAWVTRLKPILVRGKQIFDRVRYRNYRNGDRIRWGLCDFNDPEGDTFRMRVIEVERREKGTVTYLGASVRLAEEWTGSDLADLYFARWPNQEANFRAVNQAVDSKMVFGYGKQLVENVSVITKLDTINQQIGNLQQRTQSLHDQVSVSETKREELQKDLRKNQRRHETVTRQLADRVATGQRITPKLQQLLTEQGKLAQQINKQTTAAAKVEKRIVRDSSAHHRVAAKLQDKKAKQTALESRRRIFRHDVELDSLISLCKVGLVMQIVYVLREFLGNARMDPETFLERIATLPAWHRPTDKTEHIRFEYNSRDPDVMGLLAQYADAINERRLRTRTGRLLRIEVDPPPRPSRPPPDNRAIPGDRFR